MSSSTLLGIIMRRVFLVPLPLVLLGCELVLGSGDRKLAAGGSTSSATSTGASSSTLGATSSTSTSSCGDTTSDVMNCGKCGNVCGTANTTGVACTMGKCVFTCDTSKSYAHCAPSSLDSSGCDVDILTNNDHCGDCTTPCAGTSHCSKGSCCAMGMERCFLGCQDVTGDSKNCGSCGHDCLGGGCTNGHCTPVILANAQTYPTAMAIDKSHIYWTNYKGAEVRSLDRLASPLAPSTAIASSTPAQVNSLATNGTPTLKGVPGTDASMVYYGTYAGGTFEVGATGIPNSKKMGPTTSSAAMAFGGGYVFWSDRTPPQTMARFQVGGVMSGTFSQAANAAASANGIVADDALVYWSDGGLGKIFSASVSTAVQCDEAASNGCHKVADATHPLAIAEDATNVYWSEVTGSYAIYRMPKATGVPTIFANTVAIGGAFVGSLASDGTTLYWADFGDNSIRSWPVNATQACSETGGTPACTIIDGPYTGSPEFPSAVVVDDQAVYWDYQIGDPTNTYNTGMIKRLAK